VRLATDTGGTFTDLLVEDDDGLVCLYKASTTPSDPIAGVLDALGLAAADRGLTLAEMLGRADTFIHGTTHAINAIITGRAAKTALIVTEGHRDMLVFREGGRLEPFNQTIAYPKPYVPRSLTFEAPGRIVSTGEVLRPLDEAACLAVLDQIAAAGVEAVAVALLWSTMNPAHELRLGELIEARLRGVPYTLSHAVNPTLREFRRASSAAIDASLKPLMSRYLGGLSSRLAEAGFAGQVMVLTSAGGMLEAADVAEAPIRVINSGPSMAPLAGRHYAELEGGWRNAVIADTGGTTYDISLVRDADIPMTRDLWIGQPSRGHLVGYPSVDVKSVGAGGGSIANVDSGGLLHVGPQSAGSTPGPACYGRGGERPTVTDACLVLGYLDPDFFLGGAMRLDVEAAREAIERDVARPLGLSVADAAWNILSLATENMVQAIQEITVNQGVDPADAVLVGGGGAAGLNSVFIARRLGCRTLVIPETGAALSAAGAMMSDLTAEYAASVFTTTAGFDAERVNAVLGNLTDRCAGFAARAKAGAGETRIRLIAEARYENQVWDIDAPLEEPRFNGAASVRRFRERFDAAHERIFTIADPDSSVEIVGLRAQVRCRVRDEEGLRLKGGAGQADARPSRPAYFRGGFRNTAVYRLESLAPGAALSGPALIESPFTTIVVDPDASFRRSPSGSIVIETREAS
jgi:N-methylhydantoinase A